MSIHNEVTRKARRNAGVNTPAEASHPAVEAAGQFAPLARTERVPRRAKTERGLSADGPLARLARRYLEIQGKNWPKQVEAGLLPPSTDEVVAEMVHDFKIRHRSGKVDPALIKPFTMLVGTLGGSYCRYSCDNSTDLSIDDQMAKILAKGLADHCFIPWLYVYCDYSVTGQDASRQGYASYKRVLDDGENHIAGTYIDDFTRASRDEIEWWHETDTGFAARQPL